MSDDDETDLVCMDWVTNDERALFIQRSDQKKMTLNERRHETKRCGASLFLFLPKKEGIGSLLFAQLCSWK
jgi:hypothetical protein